MEKINLETKNLAQEKFVKLAELFPNAITETIVGYDENGDAIIERAVDADVLRQEIAESVLEGREERYEFTWPDKKQSILLANSPINKTLRPIREDSVNFDETENLYIEGDNLDVLKLLRETYLGKIKMIYIDPPYNTGNDFVYEDDYAQSIDEYREISGDYDEDDNRLFTNTSANGRYHTDWLNMMYPRLKLARDLLSDDGVVFISIDDNEVENLKKICNEIYGESNFITTYIWRRKTGASDTKHIATITEYILCYSKNKDMTEFHLDTEGFDRDRYRLSDEYEKERGKHYIDNLDRGGIRYSDSLNYAIKCPDGSYTYPNGRKKFENDGWTWTWGKTKVEWGIKNGFIVFKESNNKNSGWGVYYKNYLKVNNKNEAIKKGVPYKNVILDIINTEGTKDINELFDSKVFPYTKPRRLIKAFLKHSLSEESLILDFFSGSATTAHAVMELNAEDSGNRKYIMVQVPELTDEKSEAHKAGYKNICEIGKERIRRAGAKIKEENPDSEFDDGFRVLRLDSSNMKDVYHSPAKYDQSTIDEHTSNIKEDRSKEDLLFQVMLSLGTDLSAKIAVEEINDNKIFIVEDGYLVACFDDLITETTIESIAKKEPYYAVFTEGKMSDSTLANFEQIFATYSPTTIRKVI